MGEDLIGGIVGAGSSLLGGFVNNLFNRSNMKKQYQYNTKLQEQQQQYTTDMWNKNNAYNDPSAQRDRLNAAGLNPIMMNQVQGNTSQVASPAAGGSVGLPSSTTNLSNPLLEAAQIANLNADTKSKEANALLTQEQKKQQQILNKIAEDCQQSDTLVKISENWKNFHENTLKREVLDESPETIKTAYLDTWKTLSAQTLNVISDTALKDSNKEVNDKQKEYIEEQKEAIQKNLDLLAEQIQVTKRGQDVQKQIAQMQAHVMEVCKQMDVMIARIGASAGVEIAHINAGFKKNLLNVLQPALDFLGVKVDVIFDEIEKGVGFIEAVKKAFNIKEKKPYNPADLPKGNLYDPKTWQRHRRQQNGNVWNVVRKRLKVR